MKVFGTSLVKNSIVCTRSRDETIHFLVIHLDIAGFLAMVASSEYESTLNYLFHALFALDAISRCFIFIFCEKESIYHDMGLPFVSVPRGRVLCLFWALCCDTRPGVQRQKGAPYTRNLLVFFYRLFQNNICYDAIHGAYRADCVGKITRYQTVSSVILSMPR